MAIINRRMMRAAINNKLISEAQNGFLPINGCKEQSNLLKQTPVNRISFDLQGGVTNN